MCGISGVYGKYPAKVVANLYRMNNALKHRGPDDEGYVFIDDKGGITRAWGDDSNDYVKGNCKRIDSYFDAKIKAGFCHRRFSIIDLTHHGHQPWHDKEAGNILVYNGEIYNYIELREELIKTGEGPFYSDSDTEIVAAAYRKWGTSCFNKFNGFWALAIYDTQKNIIILSRDRFGKKPLYLYRYDNSIYFSSELKSLFSGMPKDKFDKRINDEAAFLYLLYDRRNTFFDCMWEGIEQVPQSHFMIFDLNSGSEKTVKYWKMPEERMAENDISIESATRQLKELLHDAVKIRLRSDVPLEANLSGGMDSSAIVAHAAEILGKHNKKLNTHLIRYYNDSTLDESYYANSVAKFTNVNHNELWMSAEDAWDKLNALVYILEEPVHSMAFFTQWIAWKAIAGEGYKVMLHGSANDELMLGYEYLSRIEDIRKINKFKIPSIIQGNGIFHPMSVMRLGKWSLQGLLFPNLSNPIRRIFNLPDRRIIAEENNLAFHKKLFSRDFIRRNKAVNEKFNDYFLRSNQDAGSRMKADFEMLRIPFWNNTMDKSMMSIPIEVRFPFLDYRIVELAFKVPLHYHYKDGVTKYLLRKSLEGMLPDEVIWRKKKMGFSVPKKEWMWNNLEWFQKTLCENPTVREYVNVKYIKDNNYKIDPNYLWRIVNFSLWAETFLTTDKQEGYNVNG